MFTENKFLALMVITFITIISVSMSKAFASSEPILTANSSMVVVATNQ